MEVAINGHLDILMVLFLLLCIYFMLREKWIFCGIALGLAVLSKLIPIILAPVIGLFLLWEKNKRIDLESFKTTLKFLLPLLLTVGGFYALYFKSAENMFATALNYSSKWYFNNPVFGFILGIFKQNETAHAVSFSLFIALYLFILFKPMPLRKKIFYTFLAFTLLNPTLHPWYLTALLALLCIYKSPAIMLWSGLAVTTYFVVYRFKTTGIWEDSWLIMTVEYLPVALLALWQKFKPSEKSVAV
jgi:hypothetical protein